MTTKTKSRKTETEASQEQEVKIVMESKPKTNKPRNVKLPAKAMPELSFNAWWMRAQKKHNFDNSLKEVVFKHFKARGFLKSKKFDDGLRDFGVKS